MGGSLRGIWQGEERYMSDWLERNRGYIFLILLNIVTVGLVLVRVRQPQPTPLSIQTPAPALATPTAGPLHVYVCGAVARADVYLLAPGSIVKDALLAAGGATSQADLTRINLALPVQDGEQVYVPEIGKEEPPTPPSSAGKETSKKVNINKATLEELESLPGIGAVYAQNIIEYRKAHGPFQTIEELDQVQGIGPATINRLRDLVTLR